MTITYIQPFSNRSLYTQTLLLWLALSCLVVLQMEFYPIAHFGYSYYGVAYNMWAHHAFWYPSWQDTINVQKPPLFYWLTHLCWWLFGVHHLCMPVIILCFALLTAIYAAKTTLVLSNDLNAAKITSSLVLINLIFLNYLPLIRFDIQLSFCVILSFYALIIILHQARLQYWWLYLFANLLGILFKGPVIFIFTLPAALAGVCLLPSRYPLKNYLLHVFSFTFGAILLTGLWLIPANIHSHGTYLHTIFQQTWQRFDHLHPDPYTPEVTAAYHWWYPFTNLLYYTAITFILPFVCILPLFAMPIYQGLKNPAKYTIARFIMIGLIVPIITFAIGVGLVRYRYMLPLIPLVCVLYGYLMQFNLSNESHRLATRVYCGYTLICLTLAVGLLLLVGYKPSISLSKLSSKSA